MVRQRGSRTASRQLGAKHQHVGAVLRRGLKPKRVHDFRASTVSSDSCLLATQHTNRWVSHRTARWGCVLSCGEAYPVVHVPGANALVLGIGRLLRDVVCVAVQRL